MVKTLLPIPGAWVRSQVRELNPICCSEDLCAMCLVVSDSLPTRRLEPTWLLCPWDSPGKTTAVGCHALLEGIFPTQGSNPGLMNCRRILYCLSYQGRPSLSNSIRQASRPIFPTFLNSRSLPRVFCFVLNERKMNFLLFLFII